MRNHQEDAGKNGLKAHGVAARGKPGSLAGPVSQAWPGAPDDLSAALVGVTPAAASAAPSSVRTSRHPLGPCRHRESSNQTRSLVIQNPLSRKSDLTSGDGISGWSTVGYLFTSVE